jgi:hypothetical protein
MGLTVTLSDSELPVSPSFVEFVYGFLTGAPPRLSAEEELPPGEKPPSELQDKARVIMSRPDGVERVVQSYRYFKEMLVGRPDTLQRLRRFRFFFVVGIPHSGGAYLTRQLFRAIGLDDTAISAAPAHDGFPDVALLSFEDNPNLRTNSLLQLAEYLTMVEMYFTKHGKLAYKGAVVVPKKFTKAVYNFPLLRELCGANSYSLITLRHPLTAIRSALENGGGVPPSGRFIVRTQVERWASQDWRRLGTTDRELARMTYFEVMLGYWKRYHYQLALAGMPLMPTARVAVYGRDRMMRSAAALFAELGVNLAPEEFKATQPMPFDREQETEAEAALGQMASFWRDLGITFPLSEMAERQ